MNYTLAKELKEAGFDKDRLLDWVCYRQAPDMDEYMPRPTLAELINACGDVFRWLKHIPKGRPEQKWMAQGRPHWKDENGKGLKEPHCFGSTPEEAVARLWLALSKQ